MKIPHKTLERKLFQSGHRHICAVDEVGMGSLAGPVVVCAVVLNKNFYKKAHKKLHWLRDSKLLSPNQREKFLAELIKTKHLKYQISYCYPKTIDRLNIYQAARLAMKRAINKITNKRTIVLVDGKTKINGIENEQIPIIKGDRKVFAIACASIIAKVHRDKTMKRYAKRFPDYGFEKHMGYGTKYHRARLASMGPSEIHRRSFEPVSKLI